MAAYGALLSLMHIIDQLQRHPRPPITLDETQAQSLTGNIACLQKILEEYSSSSCSRSGREEVDGLQNRIRDAAYEAEDIIESHVVDQILGRSTDMSAVDLHEDLQKVIQVMSFIKKVAMEIKDRLGIEDISNSSESHHTVQNNIVVGFDAERYEMLNKVVGGEPTLQIIPIVGKPGIGKTTLAQIVYTNSVIEDHFEIRAWVTMSKEYDVQNILLQMLDDQRSWEISSQMGERELGAQLYESLLNKRYLIIMDGMWRTEPWEKIKCYLPDNSNGSRIIVTTRSSKVAMDLSGTSALQMRFLHAEDCWALFSRTVFGEQRCPLELQRIGMEISRLCRGLPLAITIIGGLLARSNRTRLHWEYILDELRSIMNSEDDQVFELIHLSYSLLPIHLKPCFLHLGIFPQDSEIHVSELLKMWVAEGFLKPISIRNLEDVAYEYLKDLIQRNLVLVRKWIVFCRAWKVTTL